MTLALSQDFFIVRFILHGGFFMYLLLACSVVSVATMILRGWALRREKVIPAWLWNEIERLHPGEGGLRSLAGQVDADASPLARITSVALAHVEWPRAEAEAAAQTRARHEVVHMEAGLVVLEVIVGIAPLLGLLGAVSGLVTVFGNLGASETVSDPRGIALGISEALNTTIAGLAIAIPSLIAYSYFSKKVETLSVEMESITGELLSKCYSQKRRLEREPGRLELPQNTEPVRRLEVTVEPSAPQEPQQEAPQGSASREEPATEPPVAKEPPVAEESPTPLARPNPFRNTRRNSPGHATQKLSSVAGEERPPLSPSSSANADAAPEEEQGPQFEQGRFL